MSRLPAKVAENHRAIALSQTTHQKEETEALALEWAKCELLKFQAAGSPWGDPSISPFSNAAGLAYTRSMLRNAAMCSEINRRQVIALARAGAEDARVTLRDLIGDLERRGIALPAELTDYKNEVFMLGHAAPTPHGEKFQKRFVRNLCIVITVSGVLKNFPSIPETGRSPRRRNACDIVAEALGAVGINMGAKNVEQVWLKYGRTAGVWIPISCVTSTT